MNPIDQALQNVSYGLYSLGADDNGKPVGCIVNTISQVTAENPIVSVSLNQKSYTAEIIQKTKRFSVSILSEQADPSLFGKLGFFSGRTEDKWSGVDHFVQSGLPFAKGACAHLICELIAVYPAETHFVMLARVKDAFDGDSSRPMTYQYYHEVVKGKAPKSAPTFHQNSITTEKEDTKMAENVSYICTVCGYVYEGDITQEPDDYVCPLCGVGKDMFELQEK